MKKLIFIANFLCISALLLSTLYAYGMEKVCHYSLYEECQAHHIRKKQIKKNSEQSRTYNQENPFIKLTTRNILNNILPYCHAEYMAGVTKLYFTIKNFLALKVTCKHFNTILPLQTIGTLCKDYNFTDKNELLKRLLLFSASNIRRLMTVILIYADADVNTKTTVHKPLEITYSSLGNAIMHKDTSLISLLLDYNANPNQLILREPALFNAQTKTIAQMLIDKGANIHAKSFAGENILWHIVSNGMPVKLIKFYVQKGVDTQNIRKRDNACILHHLASKAHPHVSDPNNFLKQGRRLLAILPEIINIVNTDNQTPLDVAQVHIKNNLTPRVLKKLIKLFKEHGGKTAYELQQETWPVCFICLDHQENILNMPCSNKHDSEILCLNCYSNLLAMSNSCCPLCRGELKK